MALRVRGDPRRRSAGTVTPPPHDGPRLLSVREVADFLGISVASVRRMIDRGDLAAIVVGERSIRITAAELDRYIRAHVRDGEDVEE